MRGEAVTLALVMLTVALALAGCPRTGSPVDTSQAILVEAGAALQEVDTIVEPLVTTAGEETRADVREELECPPAGQECLGAMDLYQVRMRPWEELVAALAATAGTLGSWQAANDAWRQEGVRPRDWNVLVCQPVGTMTDTVLRLLVDLELDVPAALRGLAGRTAELCNLGVMAAEALSAGGETDR